MTTHDQDYSETERKLLAEAIEASLIGNPLANYSAEDLSSGINQIVELYSNPYLNGSKSLTNYSARELTRALYETGKKELIETLEPELTKFYGPEKIEQLWKAVMQADEALREIGESNMMKIIDAYKSREGGN